MKKVITLFTLVFAIGIFTTNAQCCNKTAQGDKSAQALTLAKEGNESAVEVYYFHFQRRCVTCRTVERVSTEILQDLYGDKIQLKSINLDEKQGEELAKKVGAEGQALLFVNGTKKVDLTFEGFMYAQTDPGKFKEKIKATIESLK
jgi:hypothetical protein